MAAGHRPCAECRREDYVRFSALWRALYGETGADTIDGRLHAERVDAATRGQRLHAVSLRGLPDGAFVLHDGRPHVVLGETLREWSPAGYLAPTPRPDGTTTLITPPSLVAILDGGWQSSVPFLHPSAGTSR
jgi:hypothetical protein